MKTDRRWYELRLVTLLAMFVTVGAWSWAQRHVAQRLPAIFNSFDDDIIYLRPGSPEWQEFQESRQRAVEAINSKSGRTRQQITVATTAVGPQISSTVADENVNLNDRTVQSISPATVHAYAWPTKSWRWNLAIGLLLLIGTGLVVEFLTRRRMRVTLAELLLAVTVVAVGFALAQSYWAETQLAERAMAVRVILLAGGYCVLLVVGWGIFAAVRRSWWCGKSR